MSDELCGLYRKFDVRRVSDPTGKHVGCEYFVLDLMHDPHAKAALQGYARSCQADYPELARDLRALTDGPQGLVQTVGARDSQVAESWPYAWVPEPKEQPR